MTKRSLLTICLALLCSLPLLSAEPKNFSDKNELLSFVASVAVGIYLQTKGYGELKEFSLNNRTKKFFFKVKLQGEEKELSVAVNRYELIKEDGKYFFVAKDITTDREWLNIAAKEFLQEKKIEIPQKYSLIVGAVL